MECCPKAVVGALASQMGGQLLCLGGIVNVGCKSGQQGTVCIRKYWCDYGLPPLLSTGHMALNAEFWRRAALSFT